MLDNSDKPKVDADNRDGGRDNDRKWRRAEVALAAVIAIATIVQAVTSWWQWSATRDQYKVMEKQLGLMQIDQRPWVSIETPIRGKPATDGRKHFTLEMRNSGKTPATITHFGLGVVYVKAGKWEAGIGRADAKFDEDGRLINVPDVSLDIHSIMRDMRKAGASKWSHRVIAPGGILRLPRAWDHGDKGTEAEVASGKSFPVVVIWIDYTGTDSEPHQTRAAFTFLEKGGEFVRDDKSESMD